MLRDRKAHKQVYFIVFGRSRALANNKLIKITQGFSSPGVKTVRRAREFEAQRRGEGHRRGREPRGHDLALPRHVHPPGTGPFNE